MICPAEQTCIIDDAIYDEMIAEFERMGARLLTDEEAAKIAEFAFGCGRQEGHMDALGQPASELAARAGFTVSPTTKILLAPLPSDLDELAAHPLVQEKLMPVLGVVRARDVAARHRRRRAGHRARRAGPHVGDLRQRRRR